MKLVTYVLTDGTELVSLLTDETAKRMTSDNPVGYTWRRDYSGSSPLFVTNGDGESVQVIKALKNGENRQAYWTNLNELRSRVISIRMEEAFFDGEFVRTSSERLYNCFPDGYCYIIDFSFEGKDGLREGWREFTRTSEEVFENVFAEVPNEEFEQVREGVWVHQHPEKLSCGLAEYQLFEVLYNGKCIRSTLSGARLEQVLPASVNITISRKPIYEVYFGNDPLTAPQ